MSGAREWLTKVKRKLTGNLNYEDIAAGWNGKLELAKETIQRWTSQDVAELRRNGAADAVISALVDQPALREGFGSDREVLLAFLTPLMVETAPWKEVLALLIETGDAFLAQVLRNLKRDGRASGAEVAERKTKIEAEIEKILETSEAVETRDAKLVHLYTELADLHHKLLEHAEYEADRKAKLTALVGAAKSRQVEIEAEIATTKVHAHAAQSSKQQREEQLIPKIAELKDERDAVDKKLEELENVKQRLKMELEKISLEIVQVQEQQKTLMAKEEHMNKEIDQVKTTTADTLNQDCDKEEVLRVEARAKIEALAVLHDLLKANDADKLLLEVRSACDAADEVAAAALDRHTAALKARADTKDGHLVEDVRKLLDKISLRFLSDDRKKELQNLV